jgi:arginine decarboxylase
MSSQESTPLLSQLQKFVNSRDTPFYAPGHKQGQGISQELSNLLGKAVFKADLPELPDLDNLFAPTSVIKEAQILASEAFGADKTWFLVNGSSGGIIAAILATCGVGDKIILPRNIHKSAISGLILSGAQPVFINPEYNSTLDLSLNITPESLENALKLHPDTKAVLVVSPTYQGVCCHLETIAQITHNYSIPLLVDEAHGAHFAFHPDLPPAALSLGADISIQSTHKVLGALTQASMLHLKGDRVNLEKIDHALQLVQTTSPSYLLLASLDGARKQMAMQGLDLLTKTLDLATIAQKELNKIPNISVLDFPHSSAGCYRIDRTRLTVIVKDFGLSGYEIDDILRQKFAVTAELPTLNQLTFIISIGNTGEQIDRLITAFQSLESPSHPSLPATSPLITGNFALSPREAFFAPTETVSRQNAINRLSANVICPYPPGIPVLMPGELISQETLDYLQTILSLGGTITGGNDDNLETFRVLK